MFRVDVFINWLQILYFKCMLMKIKEAINKILWSIEKKEEYFLIIVDRMSSFGYTYIPFSRIRRVDNNYVYICEDICSNDLHSFEKAIPIHRVVRIEKNDGNIIWSRR